MAKYETLMRQYTVESKHFKKLRRLYMKTASKLKMKDSLIIETLQKRQAELKKMYTEVRHHLEFSKKPIPKKKAGSSRAKMCM